MGLVIMVSEGLREADFKAESELAGTRVGGVPGVEMALGVGGFEKEVGVKSPGSCLELLYLAD